VGYAAGAEAYRRAVEGLDARELTTHYRDGLRFFHEELVPHVKARLSVLTGGAWTFDDASGTLKTSTNSSTSVSASSATRLPSRRSGLFLRPSGLVEEAAALE